MLKPDKNTNPAKLNIFQNWPDLNQKSLISERKSLTTNFQADRLYMV